MCFCVFLQKLGAIFSNQTTLGAIFGQIFRDFARIFDKSKLWVCACTPASYTIGYVTNVTIRSRFLLYVGLI